MSLDFDDLIPKNQGIEFDDLIPPADIAIADPMGTAGADIMAAAAPRKTSVMDGVPTVSPNDMRRAAETNLILQAVKPALPAPLDLRAAPPPIQPRGIVRAGADTALGIYQGAAGLVKGVADNINAGDNPVSGFFDTAIAGADRLKSDDLRQQQINRAAEIYAAGRGGEVAAARAAFNSLFSQPAAGLDVVAKGVGSIAPTVALGAAGLGTRAMGATNALSNAGDAASQTADTLRKLPPAAWANDADYQTLIGNGVPHDEAVALLAPIKAIPAQVVGGVAGAVSGATGMEKVLAGTAVGNSVRQRLGRSVAEILGEQGETLLPQAAGNVAVGAIDGTTAVTSGLGQAAVDTLAGTVPGAAMAARAGHATAPIEQPADSRGEPLATATNRVEPPPDIGALIDAIAGTATIPSKNAAPANAVPEVDFGDLIPTISAAAKATRPGPDTDTIGRAESSPQAKVDNEPTQPVLPAADPAQPATTDVERMDAAVPAEPQAASVPSGAEAAPVAQPVNGNTAALPANTAAAEMAADVEKPYRQPDMLSEKSMQIETASEGLRPGDVVAASGKPFKTKAQAITEAKHAGKGWTVKKGAGGFVVRYQPQTAAQIANTDKLMRSQKQVDPTRDSMFAAIAKLGGIQTDQLTKEWGFDPKEIKSIRGAGVKRIATQNGKSLDRMAESLAELGYLSYDEHGKHDLSELFDLFDGELRGNKHYTPQGFENVSQGQQEAQHQEWLSQQSKEQLDAQSEEQQHAIETFIDEFAVDEFDAAEEARIEREAIEAESIGTLGRADEKSADGTEEVIDRAFADTPEGAPGGADTGQRTDDAAQGADQVKPDFALQSETPDEAQARTEREAQQRAEQERKDKEQEQRAQADAERGSFTLTGSDRPADTQAAQGQKSIFDDNGDDSPDPGKPNETRQHRDTYTKDIFGEDLPATVRNDTNAQPEQGADAAVNLDTAGTVPDQGTFTSKTKLVTHATRTLGATKAATPDQVATAMSYLGRGAVERFDALVTDKDGNPLAIVGAFKGALTQAAVYPATLIGEAFRVKGAAHIWFAHNHPSGRPDLSQADRALNDNLLEAFRGSGIEAHGIFAIAGSIENRRDWMYTDGRKDLTGTTSAPTATMPISVVEREYSATGKMSVALRSPDQAKFIAKNLAAGETGILLFDAQMFPVGFTPVDVAMPLRKDGRMDAIYRAISMANASSAMIINQGKFSNDQVRNVAGLLNSIDVRVVDVMDVKASGVESMAEKGMDFSSKSFFSSGSRPAGISAFDRELYGQVAKGTTAKPILQAVADVTTNKLYRELAQKLINAGVNPRVHAASHSELINALKDQGEVASVDDVRRFAAAYLPKTDEVMLFRVVDTERHLMHEFTHAATMKAIRSKSAAARQMADLFRHVKQSGKANGAYGLKNIDEFVAEGFSNPEFQQALRDISAPGDFKSAWDKFVEIIRRILGLGTEQRTAFDQFMQVGDALIDQQAGRETSAGAVGSEATNPDTIEVDGVERARNNSEGKPISYITPNLENFWRWYGDGPVDGQGRPIVTDRHYTNADGQRKSINNAGTFDADQPSALFSDGGQDELDTTPKRDGIRLKDFVSTERDAAGRRRLVAGQKAYDALSEAIQPLLAKVKLSNDAPAAFKDMMRQFQVDQNKAQSNAKRIAEVGTETLTPAERVLVSDIIEKNVATGDLPPEHVAKIATDIGAALQQQAKDLVDLGMVSNDRLIRDYLPRAYRNPILARATNKDLLVSWYQKAKLRINGNHLKSRGLVNVTAIKDIAKFQKLGWRLSSMPDGEAIPADLKDALENGTKLPPQYATRDMQVVMWRDFTADERAKMGEIRDGILRYAMGYVETQRDIAIGRLYKAIAGHDELSSAINPGGWTKVPDQEIPGTSGVKRYGALSGLYVPTYIRDVIERSTQPKGPLMQMYDKALSFWKEGKTVWNPVSHGNNVVSNVFTMHFAGLNPADPRHWRNTVKEYRTKGKYYQEATDNALFGNEFASKEIQELFLPDLKDELDIETVVASRFNKVVNALVKTGKPVSVYRDKMQKAYEFEDQFFKLMLFIDRRKGGASIEDAIKDTERYIFNYSDIPEGVELLKRIYSPFISYTYKALPMLVHTALTRPDRLLVPIALLGGANWLAYALTGGDEDDERKGMPEYMQGRTAIGTPKSIRMPFNIGDRPAFMDISRRVPLGDLFDLTNQTGGASIPAPFMPSHPLFTATAAMLFNIDTFTGKDLVKKSDTSWEAAQVRADWLWKQMAPNAPFVPGSWNYSKLMNGAANAFDTEMMGYTGYTKAGDPTPLATALLDVSTGTKIRSFDPERGKDIQESGLNKEFREIQANIRSAQRNKAMTESARESYIAEQQAKQDVLKKKRDELR